MENMHEQELFSLREVIAGNDIKELSAQTELFRGADIIVSDDPNCPDSNGWSVYTKVVTPFAKEVSWLILQLKEIFSGELDYMNKFFFYGELADAANAGIANGNGELQPILNSILDEAEKIRL